MDKCTRDLMMVQAAMAEGRPERAVRLLRQVLLVRPRDPEVLSLLAVALFESGDGTAALDAAHRAVAVGPRSARAHYNLAVLLRRRGDAGAAVARLDKALEVAPDHPAARIERAQALAELGRNADAVDTLLGHLHKFPDDVEAYRDLAIFAERAGRWQDAADAWIHVAAHGSDRSEAAVRLVAVRAELDGSDAARAHAEDFSAATPGLRHRLDKALTHAGRGMLALKP
jgi:Flp pilus assembly protein TadD